MLVGKEQRRVWEVDEGPFVTEKRAASDLSFGRTACLEQVFDAVPPQLCYSIERIARTRDVKWLTLTRERPRCARYR